ncbi:MAG: hypothetical protein LBP22_00610 [Deltaproteobacteria bacterium]|jgi:hypothetical protein|nr:hypothetical protein [Deltaproteobacteria bacterium]
MNLLDKLAPLAGLAIGSVPFTDPAEALDCLAGLDIPAYPQMVKVSFYEDMIYGALDGLPFIKVLEAAKKVIVPKEGLDENLALFYENFYKNDFSFLALKGRSALGLQAFLKRAREDLTFGQVFLKAQVVGPLTLAQSVRLEDGTSALDDPSILEALSFGLGGKAAYLAAQIRAAGRQPVVFIDEPGLTGYGSAFSTLSAETVLKSLGTAAQTARSQGPVLLGCHVCGNTDWGLLSRAGLDILNFDAFNFLESFCLYPRELKTFLDKGGLIAWGLVPTEDYTNDLTAGFLLDRLAAGISNLEKCGLDRKLLSLRSLFSSSCGLGQLAPDKARGILKLVEDVSGLAKQRRTV